jgi:hypothetical protein
MGLPTALLHFFCRFTFFVLTSFFLSFGASVTTSHLPSPIRSSFPTCDIAFFKSGDQPLLAFLLPFFCLSMCVMQRTVE